MIEKVPVYILSGGKSLRFGNDKAIALYNERPLILHVAQSVKPIAESITVVADISGKYDHLGLRTIEDNVQGLGPAGGLQSAILDMDGEGWLFLTSCDLLGIKPEWINKLLKVPRDNAQIIAFHAKIWETLFALYHTSVINEINKIISKGNSAIWRIYKHVKSIAVPYPDNWCESRNINTPSDLLNYDNVHEG